MPQSRDEGDIEDRDYFALCDPLLRKPDDGARKQIAGE